MILAGERVAAILNTHSGGGGYKRDVPLIFQAIRGLGYQVEEMETTEPGDASRLAREAVAAGFDLVCAVGGDGTVNETINGLAGSDVPLVIIPTGTVNVLAMELGIPLDPPDAVKLLEAGTVSWIDLGRAGDRYLGLMAGVGMDAAVVASMHPTMKKALKEAAFAVQGVGTYLTHEDPLFRVTCRAQRRGLLRRLRQLVQLRRRVRHHAARRHARRPAGRAACSRTSPSSARLVLDAALINAHIKHRKVEFFRTESPCPRHDGEETPKCRPDRRRSGRQAADGVQGRAARPARGGALTASRRAQTEDAPHDSAHHAAARGRARRHPRGHAASPRRTWASRSPAPRRRDCCRGAGAGGRGHRPRARPGQRLVEEALAAAPRDVLLAGSDASVDVRCDGADVHLTLDGTGAYTLDHRSGLRRPSTMQDLADASLVADAAPEVGVVWNVVSAADAPPNTQVLDELVACLTHTGKHVQGEVQRAEEVPFVMEVLAAAAEGGRWDPARPFFSIVYCPVPPLQHEPEMVGAGIALAREGVPLCVYSMGLTGATAPVTLAGAVAQANAGGRSAPSSCSSSRAPVWAASTWPTPACSTCASGAYAAAAPESVLITQAMVGMARRYDLPVMATGFTGDANGFSMMSGSDAGMTALASMLMAPDLLVGAGMLDGAQMLSLPKILLDCELFRQCRRVRAGLTVDDDHLMLDVVADVGPGGHFLKAKETRQYMRSGELYVPRLMLREPYDAWKRGRDAESSSVQSRPSRRSSKATGPRLCRPGAAERIDEIIAAAGRELATR